MKGTKLARTPYEFFMVYSCSLVHGVCMTDNRSRKIYEAWAPYVVHWSRYVKPVLFTRMPELSDTPNTLPATSLLLPSEVNSLFDARTAVVVDLPGEESVLRGLALAQTRGYRPVPMFNSVPETQTGGLKSAVDNSAIITNLILGADLLPELQISPDAPPAFLLDSNRNTALPDSEDVFDNRWSVAPEDFPRADYMLAYNINKLVIWTNSETADDLTPIITAYKNADIDVLIHRGQNVSHYGERRRASFIPVSETAISDEVKKSVCRFKTARMWLLIFSVFSFIQLFVMFSASDEPLIWTSPALLWIVYVHLAESIANIIAMVLPVVYLALYLLSNKRREAIVAAAAFFAIDSIVFLLFAISWGLGDFDFIELGIPILILFYLARGAVAWSNLRNVSDDEYSRAKAIVQKERAEHREHRGYGGRGHGGYRGGFGGGGYGG